MRIEARPPQKKRPTVLVHRHQELTHTENDGTPIPGHFDGDAREKFLDGGARHIQFGASLPEVGVPHVDEHGTWMLMPKVFEGAGYKKPIAAASISRVDGEKKYSEGYNACLGLIGMAIDKDTNEPISFLSHIDPATLLARRGVTSDEQQQVHSILMSRLTEIANRAKRGSLSLEIVGGGFTNTGSMVSDYMNGVVCLGKMAEAVTHTRAMVVFGPNNELERSKVIEAGEQRALAENLSHRLNTDVYVDTPKLGITVVRPEQRNYRWNNAFPAPRNVNEFNALEGEGLAATLPRDSEASLISDLWATDKRRFWELAREGVFGEEWREKAQGKI